MWTMTAKSAAAMRIAFDEEDGEVIGTAYGLGDRDASLK